MISSQVKLIQNNVRGWLLRKNYINLREAAKTLQVAWREKKKQTEKVRTTQAIDSHTLSSSGSSAVKPATMTAITAIQAATRGMIARKAFDKARVQAMSSLVFQKSLFHRVQSKVFMRAKKHPDHSASADDLQHII